MLIFTIKDSGTCTKEATTDIISPPMELEPHYTEIATQTEKIFEEDAFTQTEDNFTEILYPEAATKEELYFFVKEHLEVVMEEESEFLISDEPVSKEIATENRMDIQTSLTVFCEEVILESNELQEKVVHGAQRMEVSEELEVVVDQVTNVLEMKNTEPVQGYATKESIVEEGDSLSKDALAEVAPSKLPENTDCASTNDIPVKMSAEAIAHKVLIGCKTEETETVHIQESESEAKQTAPGFATEFSTEEAIEYSILKTEVDHSTLRVVVTDSDCSLGNLPVIHMMENISDILHAIPEPTVTQGLAGEIHVPAGQHKTPIKESIPIEVVIHENVETEILVDWNNPSEGNNPEEETLAEMSVVDIDVPSQIWEPFVRDDKDQEFQTQPESFLKRPLTESITIKGREFAKHGLPDKSFPMTEQEEYTPGIYAFNTNNQRLNAEVVPESAIYSLIQYFAEPSVEDNASCLQVVEETISATHVMPLFWDNKHSAIFNGDPLLDNDISPKEESVAEKVLEAAIDAMSNELIIVTESSDEQSSTNEPPNVLLAGLIGSTHIDKVQP